MGELLDVVAEDGITHLGVKDRGAVHRDGDWHLAFHLWVVSEDGVLLQRRARHKESWPGFLDATAAGHLTAGETVEDGLREVEEELGVAYAFADLVPLGVHRVDEGANREHQHIFAIRDDRPLAGWDAFDRHELDGLVRVSHDGFATLLAGEPAAGEAWDGERVTPLAIAPGEVIPAPYLTAMARRLAALD